MENIIPIFIHSCLHENATITLLSLKRCYKEKEGVGRVWSDGDINEICQVLQSYVFTFCSFFWYISSCSAPFIKYSYHLEVCLCILILCLRTLIELLVSLKKGSRYALEGTNS
jgi:hypothetical protein